MKKHILILLLFCGGFVSIVSGNDRNNPSNSSVATCQENDYLALRAIYLSTDGDNWFNTTGWPDAAFFIANPTMPAGFTISGWDGVTINANGEVSRFSKASSFSNLNGTIPPEIGLFCNIFSLQINTKGLSGSIPPEIGNLTNLEILRIVGSYGAPGLTGPIPSEIQNLTNLKSLVLYQNDLSGSLPNWIGNLTSLEELELQSNNLTGPIPTSIGSLVNLERLILAANQLSGNLPTELGNLTNLTYLYFYLNEFSGSIPASIGNLTSLTFLDIGNNNLSGSLPPELANLTNVITLKLRYNDLTGTIPPEFGNMSSIETLSLGDNQLSGEIPVQLGNLITLKQLLLGNNQLTGTIPVELTNLSNLVQLDIASNELFGTIPSDLSNIQSLITLNLTSNNFSGPIPIELANLPNLEGLFLRFNNLSGELPPELAQIPSLTKLQVSNNDLTGCYDPALALLCTQLDANFSTNLSISTSNKFLNTWENFCVNPDAPCGCSADERDVLISLYNTLDGPNWTNNTGWADAGQNGECDHCNWYGVTCDQTGAIIKIDLSGGNANGNNLSGSIPHEIGNLSSLQELNLDENALTGPIPIELFNLSNLIILSLAETDFIGTIPQELSNLTNLKKLDLSRANLNGSIPPELGDLSHLEDLDLAYNDLSGELPAELAQISTLTKLHLRSNNLSGCFDPALKVLCTQLNPAYSSNVYISRYNNFLFTWEDFCADPSPVCGCSQDEQDALLALYNATDGPNWTDNSGWVDAASANRCDHCNWKGVTCDLEGKVVSLQLTSNNLTGNFPPELVNLPYLTNLRLSSNNITGSLPTGIDALANLEEIKLEINQLTGEIPSEMGNLSNLTVLHLYNNALEGCIPESLQSLCAQDVRISNSCLSHNNGDFQLFCADSSCEASNINCPSCSDGIQNGTETDIDCGGMCESCGTCTDGIQNGSETEIDCGGNNCPSCDPCSDGIQNGSETDVDCGGSCSPCPDFDLMVSSFRISNFKYSTHPGQNINLRVQIENIGLETSVSASARFYVSNDPQNSADDLELTSFDFNAINAGSINFEIIPVTIPNDYAHGVWYLNMVIVSSESNQSNNEEYLAFTIRPSESWDLPDLRSFISSNGQEVIAGDELSIEVTTKNNSPNQYLPNCVPSLINCTTGYFYSEDDIYDATDVPLGTDVVPPLAVDESIVFNPTWTIPTTAVEGAGHIIIVTDLHDDLIESVEHGNVYVHPITINAPSCTDGMLNGDETDVDCGGSCPPCPSCTDGIQNGSETAIDCGGDCAACDNCTETDYYDDLMALYNATGGDNWVNKTGWGQDCGVCEWHGVVCEAGVIVGIHLYQNNLTGAIPPEIGNMTSLEKLLLFNNKLNSSLPSTIGNLVNLTEFSLSSNQLSGAIPTEIGNMTNLKFMFLQGNQLTGPIPSSIGNLANLTNVALQDNQIDGPIPPEIGNASNLKFLQLQNNQLTGPIPSELALLTDLSFAKFSQNQLSGCIPTELNVFCSSGSFYLNDNPCLSHNGGDFDLFCTINSCVDYDPLCSLCSDGILNGDETDIDCGGSCSPCPIDCSASADYEALMALYNSTNGANWDINAGWEDGASSIDCDYCFWYGVSCDANDRVIVIDLYDNGLVGTLPPEIGNLDKLQIINMGFNSLSGILPPELGQLSELKELDFWYNNISGTIPSQLASIPTLTKISLSDNVLSGPLPNFLGNMTQLEFLAASQNSFSGPIPAGYANLINLKAFGFSYNQLDGDLPVFFGSFLQLEELFLNGNNLTGTIPSSFGDLQSLTNLHLDFNSLTGAIPPSLGNLTNAAVTLRNNNLSGCVPTELLNLCDNRVTIENNPCLSHNTFDWFCINPTCTLPDNPGTGPSNCDFSSCSNGIQDNQETGVDCGGQCLPCQIDCSSNQDIDALLALYNATNGPAWGTYGWNAGAAGTNCDVCSWQGVTCNEAGRVTELYFKAQDLSGQLPSELDQLTELRLIKISFGQLTGTIPSSLGNLQHLESLSLRGNSLIGDIPSSFADLSQLTHLDLSDNDLSGCYDVSLQSLCTQLDENSSISFGNQFDTPWDDFCNGGIDACDCTTAFFADGQLPANHDLITITSNDCPTRGTVHFNNDPTDACADENLYWLLTQTETPPTDINDDRIQSVVDDYVFVAPGTYFFYLISRPSISSTQITYLPPTTITIDEVECFPCIDEVVIDDQLDNNLDEEAIRSANSIELNDVAIDQDIETYAVDYFEIAGPFEVEPGIEFLAEIANDCECTIGAPCDDEDPCTLNDVFDEECACMGVLDPICIPDCTDGSNHGDPCDDGNLCTENDTVDSNCNCLGTVIPGCDTDCSGLNYGDPCDDGDACTSDDQVNPNCICEGTPIPECQPDCDSGLNIGDSCNDGDDCTANDMITSECLCAGTDIAGCATDCDSGFNFGDDCDDGNACTEDDQIDTNCNCVGTEIPDCDPITNCPEDVVEGSPCDDLDSCTDNDAWTFDALGDCLCEGTLIDENNNGECDSLEPCDDGGGIMSKTLKSNECLSSQHLDIVVSEFSNGEKGVDEYIELYVRGKGTFDLRGLIIDDKEGTYKSGNGFSAGRIRFANHPNWSNVKGGSLILLYNHKHKHQKIAADDPTDMDKDNIFITPLSQPYFYGEEKNSESNYYSIPPAWDLIWLFDKNDEINIRSCDERLLQRISYGYEKSTQSSLSNTITIDESINKGLVFSDLMDAYDVGKTKASPGKYNNRRHKKFIKNGN